MKGRWVEMNSCVQERVPANSPLPAHALRVEKSLGERSEEREVKGRRMRGILERTEGNIGRN